MDRLAANRNLFDDLRDRLPGLSTKMQRIARFALENPHEFIRCTSKDLCLQLETSEPTLIRFCKSFEKTGLSEFRIELALSLSAQKQQNAAVEPQFLDRQSTNISNKLKIARATLDLIENDSAILLDNGSTAERFALELGHVPAMTIMTSGLAVAQAAMRHEKHNVIVTGGTLRSASLCMTGRLVEEAVRGMRFDTFIMGAGSISHEHGISTVLEDEAQTTRVLMRAAKRVIVLADSSKFDRPSLHHICDIDDADLIVTDLHKGDSKIADMQASGAKLHLIS